MFHPKHSSYIKSLYKKILAEGALFFDDRARLCIKERTRKAFQEYKTCQDLDRIKHKLKEGRRKLHRIEQANRGDEKSATKILEQVYGRAGKTRHALLYPFLHCHQPTEGIQTPAPFITHAFRTAPPPPLSPPLMALIVQHVGKKMEPELPIPAYKPLHPGRKANLLWRHRSMLLERVQAPLPFETICELERKAGALETHPLYAYNTKNGGPAWHDFYVERDGIRHLDPHAHISPKSTLKRTTTLMDSPYAYVSPEKDLLNTIDDEEKRDELYEYSPRQIRRCYRRLLRDIPLIQGVTALTLWDKEKSYSITKSNWVFQRTTRLLEDIPSEQVITDTLKKQKNKGKKAS